MNKLQTAEAKPIPHNIEAEQAVLGALLLNNGVIEMLAGLEPEHFFDGLHAHIYRTARKLILSGRVASPVTLKTMMGLDEGLKQVGGPAYLVRLCASVISISSLPDYCATIREDFARRRCLALIEEAESRILSGDPDVTPSAVAAELQDGLAKLALDAGQQDPVHSFDSALLGAANWVNQGFMRGGKPEVSWGIPKLDELTGGLSRGNAYLIGARTSMGKTALALHTARSVCRLPTETERGRGVLFASLEMSREQLAMRVVSASLADAGTDIPYSRVLASDLSEDEFRLYLEASRAIERLPLHTIEDDCRSLPRLRAAIRSAKRRFERDGADLALVVIDYLQLIKVPDAKGKTEEVSEAAREVKSIAKEFHVPVIVLAQVKREVEDRKNKRPMLSDIRWAGEAEEAADVVAFLYRDGYYLARQALEEADDARRSDLIAAAHAARHDLEIIVEKNRGGPTGTTKAWIDLAHNRVADSEPAHTLQPEMEGFA